MVDKGMTITEKRDKIIGILIRGKVWNIRDGGFTIAGEIADEILQLPNTDTAGEYERLSYDKGYRDGFETGRIISTEAGESALDYILKLSRAINEQAKEINKLRKQEIDLDELHAGNLEHLKCQECGRVAQNLMCNICWVLHKNLEMER